MPKKQIDIDWPKVAIENIIDAIIAVDSQGIIRYINPAARRLLHLPYASIIAKPASRILKFIDGETNKNITIPTTKSFSNTNKQITLTRAIFLNSTQKHVTVNAVFTPIRIEHNTISGVALRFRDVTQLTMQDKKMWDEQKIKAIGTMAGGIADDFINWLEIMATHAAAIQDSVIPRTRAYEEAENILKTAKQAKGMTRRLISVSTLASDHKSHKLEAVDLNTIIKTAVRQSKVNFLNKQIEYIPRFRQTETPILVNETVLIDCILNIFRNSIDSMPDGGTITIDMMKSHDSSYQDHIVLRIRDTGSGMNKTTLAQACDPFFSTKNQADAMGLGLTIAKTFAQSYSGDLKIQSKEGFGTSVRIFLPLSKNNKGGKTSDNHNNIATFLIVDNNKDILHDLKTFLEESGNTVYTATNSTDALSLYKQHHLKIDITVIDVIMRNGDGKELLKSITGHTADATLILMSGFSRNYIREYIPDSTWGFLQKPISKEHLTSVIERTLK